MIHAAVVILAPPAFCKSTLFHAFRAAIDSSSADTDLGTNAIDADNVLPFADAHLQADYEGRTKLIANICKASNRTVVFTSNPMLARVLSETAIADDAVRASDRLVVRGIAVTPFPFTDRYNSANTLYIRDALYRRALDSIEWMTPALTGHIYAPSESDRTRSATAADLSALSEASAWISLLRSFQNRIKHVCEYSGSPNTVAWIERSIFDAGPQSTCNIFDAVNMLRTNDVSAQATNFLSTALMLHLICANITAVELTAQAGPIHRRATYFPGMPAWAVEALAALAIRNVERTMCGHGPVKRVAELHSTVESKVIELVRALSLSSDCLERAYEFWQAMLLRITTKIIKPSTTEEKK